MSVAVPGHKPGVLVPWPALHLAVDMHTPTPVARPPPEQGPFSTAWTWVDAIETRRTKKEESFIMMAGSGID